MVTGLRILGDVYGQYIPFDEDLQLLLKDRQILYFLLDRYIEQVNDMKDRKVYHKAWFGTE